MNESHSELIPRYQSHEQHTVFIRSFFAVPRLLQRPIERRRSAQGVG